MGKKSIKYFVFFSSWMLISCMSGRVGCKQDLPTASITALPSADSEDMWKAKIKWEGMNNMVEYADTFDLLHEIAHLCGTKELYSKELKVNERSFFFSFFPYGSGLPRWSINVLEQVGERWKFVTKGDVVRDVDAITVDYDSVNNRMEFWTLMAEYSDKIYEKKSLKKLENIGSLLIDDL